MSGRAPAAARRHVLGISAHFHDSAAALVSDGRILAAAQQERFSRVKNDASHPAQAIAHCLAQLPDGAELDAVAYYENPLLKLDRIARNALASSPRGALLWPRTVQTMQTLSRGVPDQLTALAPPDRIHLTTHHRAHAASAFRPSGLEEAAVLVVDGVGEWSTTSIFRGGPDGLEPLAEIRFPHSLGLLYSAFTQYCGFRVNSGEYKLMGLAPFGTPEHRALIREHLVEVKADGSFALNLEHFEFQTRPSTITESFEELFGQPARAEGEPITRHHMDVASSAQSVLEEVMLRLAQTALTQAASNNLCMAGGVALNCVANSRILNDLEQLEHLWIQPAAGDAGGALGAALEVDWMLSQSDLSSGRRTSASVPQPMQDAWLGPQHDDDEIQKVLDDHGLTYEGSLTEGDVIATTTDLLARRKIVGHFDGRMEFGPRALGNRSILADPRGRNMLRRVNRRIKFREGWRPFAPIVLAEHVDRLFERGGASPFMLLVDTIREEFRSDVSLDTLRSKDSVDVVELATAGWSRFPAITHCDHTSRVQTVSPSPSSRIHAILDSFHRATGCPMLLNTSFNVRGEPIVCTPQDAVEAFLGTNLDALVIGHFVVRREDQVDAVRAPVRRNRTHAD